MHQLTLHHTNTSDPRAQSLAARRFTRAFREPSTRPVLEHRFRAYPAALSHARRSRWSLDGRGAHSCTSGCAHAPAPARTPVTRALRLPPPPQTPTGRPSVEHEQEWVSSSSVCLPPPGRWAAHLFACRSQSSAPEFMTDIGLAHLQPALHFPQDATHRLMRWCSGRARALALGRAGHRARRQPRAVPRRDGEMRFTRTRLVVGPACARDRDRGVSPKTPSSTSGWPRCRSSSPLRAEQPETASSPLTLERAAARRLVVAVASGFVAFSSSGAISPQNSGRASPSAHVMLSRPHRTRSSLLPSAAASRALVMFASKSFTRIVDAVKISSRAYRRQGAAVNEHPHDSSCA